MLTSLLWFLSPFASHKSAKNLSWMAQGQKYVQGCVKAAFLIRTPICSSLYQGQKRNKMARKGANWGQSDPLFGSLWGKSAAHLLGLFILGRALENLSMAAPTRDGALFNLSLPSHPFFLRAQPKLRLRVLFCILNSEMILTSLPLPLSSPRRDWICMQCKIEHWTWCH